jgi:hypothetical protein
MHPERTKNFKAPSATTLTIGAGLITAAYFGIPIALYLLKAEPTLEASNGGLGHVAAALSAGLFVYVVVGAPVALRILARELSGYTGRLVQLERWMARGYVWVWGAGIVVFPFYMVYLAMMWM